MILPKKNSKKKIKKDLSAAVTLPKIAFGNLRKKEKKKAK